MERHHWDALLSFKMGNGYIYHSSLPAYEQDMYTSFVLRALLSLKDKETVFNKFKAPNKPSEPSKDNNIEIKNITDIKKFKLGNSARVTIEAKNNSEKPKNVTLIVVLYDKDKKLQDYVCAEQILNPGKPVNLSGAIKLPKEGEYTLKAFVWDSLEEMRPLSDFMEVQLNKLH